jgi:hypothetical protein
VEAVEQPRLEVVERVAEVHARVGIVDAGDKPF